MTLLDSRMRVPSNFGSQAQMFAGEQEVDSIWSLWLRMCYSSTREFTMPHLSRTTFPIQNNVSFRKKAIYMHLTIVFGLSLLALVVYDFIVGQWSGSTDGKYYMPHFH